MKALRLITGILASAFGNAFLAGAAFRMGAESKEEFDEAFAPSG